jgi:predicted Zn-dependent peptidase
VLAAFYVRYGDWRKLFALGPQYDQMTAAELQRVAALYFSPAGRTTAYLANGEQIGGQQ